MSVLTTEKESVMYFMPRETKLDLQMLALKKHTTLTNLLNTAAVEYLSKNNEITKL